jgi:hypothetical protein
MHIQLPDLINGLFEFFGGFAVINNCKKILHDKQVKGVSWHSTAFFAAWGGYNCFFYPFLHQWFSFIGGFSIFCANTVYIALMLKYRKN